MLTDGCPGLCNNNGRCVLDQNVWHCVCQSGWRGLGCDVATEMLCSDGKDNEGGRKKQTPSTNSLLTSAGVRLSDCAELALMWPLGNGGSKQNKSIIHKTSVEYGNAATKEFVKQPALKYAVDQLRGVVETERCRAHKPPSGLNRGPGTFNAQSRWQTFGTVQAHLSSRNLCCRFNELR